VLFLIARSPQGGPPLAVKRIAAPTFPLEFEIGAADRMIEALPFAGSMSLSARIDADGNATSRTPGDLLGATPAPVEPGASGVELLIDQLQPADGAEVASTAAPGAPIRGTVRISPELASQVPGGAVLFVIARRGESGPPLAVKRIESPRFPLDFELGPGDRMIQTLPFAGPLTVTARIDADGNAMSRSPGDLFGAAAQPVDPGATQIEVLIDRTVASAPEG
jgi:cytochrome c-type biogenesis protein CcmH